MRTEDFIPGRKYILRTKAELQVYTFRASYCFMEMGDRRTCLIFDKNGERESFPDDFTPLFEPLFEKDAPQKKEKIRRIGGSPAPRKKNMPRTQKGKLRG